MKSSIRLLLCELVLCLFACAAFAGAEQPSVPAEIQELKAKLFYSAWAGFVQKLQIAAQKQKSFPQDISEVDFKTPPPLNIEISRDDLLQLFIQQEISLHKMTVSNSKAFADAVVDLFTSYSHNQPFAKLPYLQTVAGNGSSGVAVDVDFDVQFHEIALPAEYPKNHTMGQQGLRAYIEERFPQTLLDFTKQTHAGLFMDDDSCSRSLQLQSAEGFAQAYRFMGPLDTEESQFLLLRNSKNDYRLLVCSLYGKDDKARLIAILGPHFYPQTAILAIHAHKQPLLDFDPQVWGRLEVNPQTDQVVIGYQNTVWWELHTKGQNWIRTSLVRSGVEVSEFYNTATKKRIVSLENVYGDEMRASLQAFYEKGFRRFVYLGTAGGMQNPLSSSRQCHNFKIGDVMLPDQFVSDEGQRFAFRNSASGWPLSLNSGSTLYRQGLQAWVPDLIVETIDLITNFRNSGVNADDIESQYFAKFMRVHSDITEHAVMIFISDLPPLHGCGNLDTESSYANASISRGRLMSNVNSIVDQIFLK